MILAPPTNGNAVWGDGISEGTGKQTSGSDFTQTPETAQAWRDHKVMTFEGTTDTRKGTDECYRLVTLAQVFDKRPDALSKNKAWAILPSSYNGPDGRNHEVQRDKGQFVSLTLDLDESGLPMSAVEAAIVDFVGLDTAFLIYSSASATPENGNWRGIIPLAEPVPYQQWLELQMAFHGHFESFTLVKPDHVFLWAGQPVYLQNTFNWFCHYPRQIGGEKGEPVFYQTTQNDGHGLTLDDGCVAEELHKVRIQLAREEADRARMKAESAARVAARRAAYQSSGQESPIDAFNATHTVEDMLVQANYTRQGHSDQWRSPLQQGSSFATKNWGDRWTSLSGSDAAAGLGTVARTGTCSGDAFDIWCFFQHGNNRNEAIKAAAEICGLKKKPAYQAAATAPDPVSTTTTTEPTENTIEVISKPVVMTVTSDRESFEKAMKLVEDADSHHGLIQDVVPAIRKLTGLDGFDIPAIAKRISMKATKLGSMLLRKDIEPMIVTDEMRAIRKAKADQFALLAKNKDQQSMHPQIVEILEWVFVQCDSGYFYHPKDGRTINRKTFNLIYSGAPIPRNGDDEVAADEFFIKAGGSTVYGTMYIPAAYNGDPLITLNGRSFVNTYNLSNVPKADDNWRSHNAWQIVLNHLKDTLPEGWESVLHWLAHNVQHPGVKIRWAPILVGVPGDGKTSISEIAASAMGSEHCKLVGNQALNSDFNGWAAGSCICTFEEIRIKGQSRHEFMDKLKPLITNDDVDVVRKGANSQNVINTQNYIALTNFPDALALDPDDRRWGVFQTRFKSNAQVKAERSRAYWEALHDTIKHHGAVIRGWLMSVDLSGFDANDGPAMTHAKMNMIDMSRSDDEVNLEQIIEEGGHGINVDAVSSSHVNMALKTAGFKTLQGPRMHTMLKKLGYVRVPNNLDFYGRTCRFSVKESWLQKLGLDLEREADCAKINDEIRELFKL